MGNYDGSNYSCPDLTHGNGTGGGGGPSASWGGSNCNPAVGPFNPGYFPWIATTQGSQYDTSITATNGSPVSLQFNNLIFVCHTAVNGSPYFTTDGSPCLAYNTSSGCTGTANAALPEWSWYQIGSITATTASGASAGSVSTSLNGYQFAIADMGSISTGNPRTSANENCAAQTTTRYWFACSGGAPYFSYTPNLTSSGMVNIYVTETPVAHFPSGKDLCVSNASIAGDQGNTGNDAYKCPPTTIGFQIYVNIGGGVDGIDVSATNGANLGSTFGAKIGACDGTSTTANSFSFDPLPSGNCTMTATAPAGYTITGSDWCADSSTVTGCNPGVGPTGQNWVSYAAGSTSGSTTVTVPSGHHVHMRWLFAGSGGGSTATNNPCQNWVAQGSAPSDITKITINLPNTKLPDIPAGSPAGTTSGTGSQSGASTTANQEYYQYTATPAWRIDSEQDQYSPPTTITSNSPQGTWQTWLNNSSPSTFTLDYSNYYNQYPYDPHTTTIGYTQMWIQTYWYTSSSPDYYTCTGSDPGGGSSSTCYSVDWSSPVAATNGSCPSGDWGPNLYGYCFPETAYTGTAWYDWHKSSPPYPPVYQSDTYNGAPVMPACYYRAFKVTSVNVSASLNDYEDPTQATVQGQATVSFSYPPGDPTPPNGVHYPFQVNNLGYTGQITGSPGIGCNAGPHTVSGSATLSGGNYPSTQGPLGLDPAPGYQCTFTAPPNPPGGMICGTYTVNPTGDLMDYLGNIVPAGGNSQFLSNNPAPTCSTPVTNMPYAHFSGGDVSAGGDFATGTDQCGDSVTVEHPNASANISAFIRGSGALVRGSGTQFAALATGSFTTGGNNGFGSANLRSANPTSLWGLTVANTPSPGNDGLPHCAPDIYSTNPGGGTPMGASYNLATFDTHLPGNTVLTGNGNVTLSGFTGAGNGIANGNSVAIYVNGNVYITGNIVFKNSSWSSASSVPSFYLIVKGNIYVANNVTELDGVYVAQPTGANTGAINTCANGFGPYADTALYGPCSQHQLVVNGAFIDKTTYFTRTWASLRNSYPGEYMVPGSGSDNPLCNTEGDLPQALTGTPPRSSAAFDCAAEIFNLTPDTFLGTPAIGSNNANGTKFDFITSLSPVL